jgi:hypothetical protein|tara:strand:+ start:529 stop:1032 length:504 start_codon:yes stop_codon:yes gene_type:complete
MPNRRVIFSSYVIPKESTDLEEGVTKWTIDGAINKTLGSKGTATLTGSQWGESWSSFQHPEQYWEDCGNDWEDMGEAYNGVLTISGATSLNVDTDVASVAVVFLYVKNLGTASTEGLILSLDGSNYKIYIPPQGSVNIRGDGTTLQMEDVKVNKVTDNTLVEFIIAK